MFEIWFRPSQNVRDLVQTISVWPRPFINIPVHVRDLSQTILIIIVFALNHFYNNNNKKKRTSDILWHVSHKWDGLGQVGWSGMVWNGLGQVGWSRMVWAKWSQICPLHKSFCKFLRTNGKNPRINEKNPRTIRLSLEAPVKICLLGLTSMENY